jgi:hypothetical protein
MRGTIQTTLRWMWTYGHMMIQSGTPALVADIAEFGAVVTASCGDVVTETGAGELGRHKVIIIRQFVLGSGMMATPATPTPLILRSTVTQNYSQSSSPLISPF